MRGVRYPRGRGGGDTLEVEGSLHQAEAPQRSGGAQGGGGTLEVGRSPGGGDTLEVGRSLLL